MPIDPRDLGVAGQQEWEEFRAGYAGARLFAWLLDELDEIAPDYIEDLRSWINIGICAGETMAEDDPSYDGAAIIQRPVGRDALFIDMADALLFEEQLFPHRDRAGPRDFHQTTRGLAVVALHAALESYSVAAGATAARTPLPIAIARFLKRGQPTHDLEATLSRRDAASDCP